MSPILAEDIHACAASTEELRPTKEGKGALGYIPDQDSPTKEGGSNAANRVARKLGCPPFAPTAKDELAGVMAKLARDIAEASAIA